MALFSYVCYLYAQLLVLDLPVAVQVVTLAISQTVIFLLALYSLMEHNNHIMAMTALWGFAGQARKVRQDKGWVPTYSQLIGSDLSMVLLGALPHGSIWRAPLPGLHHVLHQ